ncbi:MAG: hypothetical protein K2K98_13480 [Muribaculaceae bacterium]|nr:hypothetical protein [Muribaculaceae bacterium]
MKTIFSILSVILLLTLSACSGDPFVGEWMPSNDTSGTSVTEINSDGTVAMIIDAEDGYGKISGSWNRVSDSENTIMIKFDENTIELDVENPLIAMLMQQALEAMASEDAKFVLSEDGDRLINESDSSKSFVRK